MQLSAPSLRNFLYFRRELSKLKKQKKLTLKKFLIFRQMKHSSPKVKKNLFNSLYFPKKQFKIIVL